MNLKRVHTYKDIISHIITNLKSIDETIQDIKKASLNLHGVLKSDDILTEGERDIFRMIGKGESDLDLSFPVKNCQDNLSSMSPKIDQDIVDSLDIPNGVYRIIVDGQWRVSEKEDDGFYIVGHSEPVGMERVSCVATARLSPNPNYQASEDS